jgi:hypothetical protein
LWTRGVLVNTLEPGMAGMAHDATGLGDRSTFRQLLYCCKTHLYKTHSTITSDSQTIVVTESRNGSSSSLTCLN